MAVFSYKQEQWAGKVMAAVMRHSQAIDQLKAMARALAELRESDPACGAVSKLAAGLGRNPEFAAQCNAQFSSWIEVTASMIRKGQMEGDFRPDLDATSAAEVAVAAFVGVETLSEQLSGFADIESRVEGLISILEFALRAPA
jgi:hypothetical protein